MRRLTCILLLLLSFPLLGKEGTAPPFKGLILLSSKEDLNPGGYENVRGVMCYQVDLPGSGVELRKSLKKYYHHPLNEQAIQNIRQETLAYYHDQSKTITTVSVPHQDISSGVLQLVVTKAVLGKVTCQGNKWFKGEKLEEAIQLEPGETIASDLLNQNLYWLNRNPFRQVDAIYTPGEKEGTTDIELIAVDRFPLRLYGGIDNTGNDVTGNNRLFVGFDWGQVFWTDQRLSYQFASSSDFKRYKAHTLFYELPLPWQHLINIYGGYSHVDADFSMSSLSTTKFRTHGFSIQGSFRYDIPLKPLNSFLHEIICGFDFKRTNNNLELGGVPIIAPSLVNLTQLMCAYNMGYDANLFNLSWEIEGFWSPGKWISDQTNTDYRSLRSFAKNQYIYGRTAFTLIYRFYKGWTLHNYLRGQLASINLLPSEEYGVGGYNTVRGYKERIVNGDTALIWNFEIRTPSFSILDTLTGWKKFNDQMQLLAFYDYGLSGVKQAVPDQNKTSYLMSVGPGVRYNIIPYVTFRADWGFQLHDLDLGGPHQRLHFALIVGY